MLAHEHWFDCIPGFLQPEVHDACLVSVASLLVTILLTAFNLSAQQTNASTVPNLINYSGKLVQSGSATISSKVTGVTFAIYKQQEGGAPVWMETQNVTLDAGGHYSVLLGSTRAEGLPADLFSAQEERWLGVQVQGQAEQPRVLLVSVPYALKAQEAETLGGLPASAFARVTSGDVSARDSANAAGTGIRTGSAQNGPTVTPNQLGGGGTTNYLAMWTGGSTLGNANIFQAGSKIGIGNTAPIANLDVNGLVNATSGYEIGGVRVVGVDSLYNTYVGQIAGNSNVGGCCNTFIGFQAGHRTTSGNGNTFVGDAAGPLNSTGSHNTFLGVSAGKNNTSGNYNTFSGFGAGISNTTGFRNAFFGENAGSFNTTGFKNTYIGDNAGGGSGNGTGSQNVFVGVDAGSSFLTGSGNTFLGPSAGHNITTGSGDIYIANGGPLSRTESDTIRIGAQQTAAYMAGIYGNILSGAWPVVITPRGQLGISTGGIGVSYFNGRQGAVAPQTGDYNFIQISGLLGNPQLTGTYTNPVNLTNNSNVYYGDGSHLTGVGGGPGSPYYIQNGTAQQANANFNISGNGTVGGNLTADVVTTNSTYTIGGTPVVSISFPWTIADNLFLGQYAGINTIPNSNGENVFAGTYAGVGNTTGGWNTFVGSYAGQANGTGVYNSFFGDSAGWNNKTGDDDIYIGNIGPASGTESNAIRLGTPYTTDPNNCGFAPTPCGQTTAYIAGIYGANISSGTAVYINSNGQLGTLTSSRRFKEQIRNMGDSTNALMKLRPVTYFYKPEYDKGQRTLQYGLIAEEVAEVYPELVAYQEDGEPYTVKYQYLTTMLLNELQKQHAVVAAQSQEIDGLKTQLWLQNAAMQERCCRDWSRWWRGRRRQRRTCRRSNEVRRIIRRGSRPSTNRTVDRIGHPGDLGGFVIISASRVPPLRYLTQTLMAMTMSNHCLPATQELSD
jgi:hypothetical protein